MYLVFMILTGINLIVYFYAFLKDLQMIIETKAFKKAFEAGKNIGKDIEQTYEEKKETTNKGAYVTGVIIALILLFLAYGAIIYVPIWIGLRYGVNNAIVTYLVFLLFTTSLRLYKYGTNPKYEPKKMIIMSLVGLFRFQVMTLILFGFNSTLDSIIETIYNSNFFLNDTFTIIFPVLFFSSIIVTVYLFWVGLRINSKLNIDNKFKTKLSHFILIVITSSFVGLIYLIESDFSFIDMSSGSSFDRVQNIFMILLASILIPILFHLFGSKNKEIDSCKGE